MKDLYDRNIEYLRVSVTDRCNLRCRYCMPENGLADAGHEKILSYEEMTRICAVAARLGVRKIRLTGGEPLVRRDLPHLIRALAALPEKPEIALTSNGVLLAEMAEELKAAGLSRVNVSLDTLYPDRFQHITRRAGLEKVFEGIEAAQRVGLTPVKINMVPIRGFNDDEVADFGRLAIASGWEVRFIEFMPVGSNLGFSQKARFPFAEIKRALQEAGPLTPVRKVGPAGPARLYLFGGGRAKVGIIPAASEHFCGECNRLRLTADGHLRPCLFSRQEIDLRRSLKEKASDEAIAVLLLQAVGAKPERHRIGRSDFEVSERPMYGIGG